MKTLFILSSLLLAGCASDLYVQKSDLVVTTIDESIIYIKDGDLGKQLYEHWNQGSWGDNHIVVLLDTAEFKELYEKSYISRRSNRKW